MSGSSNNLLPGLCKISETPLLYLPEDHSTPSPRVGEWAKMPRGPLAPWPRQSPFHDALNRKSMKVITFNVKGLNMPVKRHSLYRDLRAHDADIVCLQETHFRRLDHPKLYTPQYLTQYHSTFKTKARGVTLLIHNRVAFQMHRILKDPKGRYIILVCTINSRIYTLVSIYAPNAAQSQFLSQVLQKVTDIQSGTLVICGDLNMGLDPLKDRSSTVTFHNSYSRIDYFLIAGSALPYTIDCIILPLTWSDHSPVILTLAICITKTGPTY
uniref:exodeoxyribonuclease III n=1 Tax=Leptobrachium leishanense TaxID=445787 RepID=A0A8C5PII9_9ANUR